MLTLLTRLSGPARQARAVALAGLSLMASLTAGSASAQTMPSFYSGATYSCYGCHSGAPFTSTTPPTIVATATGLSWGLNGNGGVNLTFTRTGVRQNVATVAALKTYFSQRAAVAEAGFPPHAMVTFNNDNPNSTDANWNTLRNYIFDLFDAYIEASSDPGTRILPINPATVSYGTTLQIGSSVSRTFTIKNARAGTIQLNTPTLTGTHSGLFSVGSYSCSGASTSAALAGSYADSCTVTVTMNVAEGTAAGTKNANLQITFAGSGTDPAPVTRSIPLQATTLAPTIAISPATSALSPLGFSSPVGVAVTSSDIRITNNGNGTLSLTPLMSLGGTHAADFALVSGSTSSCSIVASSQNVSASGGFCNVRVRFTPSAAGTRTATLNIPNNTGSTAQVFLSGLGETRTVAASLSATGTPAITSFTFPSTVSQGASTTSTFYVLNTGNSSMTAPTVTVGTTGQPSDATSEFTRPAGVAGGTCGSTVTTLASGVTCSVIIQFTPSTSPALGSAASTRTSTARLTFSSVNATNTASVDLTATARGLDNPSSSPAGGSSVTPTPLSLGSALVGTTGATTASIVLTNPRSNPVTYAITKTGTNASDFVVSAETCAAGRSLPANGAGTCTITYQFSPPNSLSAGSRVATVSIALTPTGTDPAPTNSPLVFSLSANATTAPSFAISATSLTLASVENTPSSPATLTVTNNGTAALNLTSLALGGTHPGDYALGGTCANGSSLPGTLAAPRSTCTVSVTFTPGAQGARNATLTLNHNDSGTNGGATVVTLNGTGNASLTPVLDVGGTSQLSFGNVLQGANSLLSFTIRNSNTNSGATALQLSGLAISGTHPGDFTRGGTCTATTSLAANASCTVTVTFAPAAAGALTASLAIITSNAGNATVALSGTGVPLADATLTGVPLAAFPTTLVTTTSPTAGTVTINNPRANSITYGTAFGGANAADFLIGSESCATRVVPAGGSCTVAVRFAPSNGAEGTRSANLVVSFVGFGTDPNPPSLSTPLSGTAALPAPAFSSSSNSLSFTAVVLSPTTGSALITNTGTASLSLSSLALSGTQAADFSLDSSNTCTAGTTLAPSSSCTLVLRYDPAAAGTSSAALTITSNAAGSPHGITLSGTAAPTPRPRISLSSLALSFGSLQVGTPASQTITVQNAGDAALNFSAFTLSGAAASDFSRSGSCAVGAALAPAAQCALTLTFNPTAAGSRNASLLVASDASNGAASVSLSGTGVPVPAPVVTLSAVAGLPLEFGSQTLGGLYPSRRVTLANTGNADLAVSAVTVEGAGFSNASASACPAVLAAGSTCDIDIAFTPTAAAADYNGNVRVLSNAAGSPHTAALHGRGVATAVPSLVWEPLVASLGFGQVNAGSVSAVQSATLRNAGPGGLRLTLLNAVGADASAFSVTAGSCQVGETLFEGQTCRIDIRFAPATAGTKTAHVQVASSGSFPTDLTLNGVGMGGPSPGLALSVRTLAFGSVRLGTQSLPLELTLSANGSGVVQVTGLLVSEGWTVQPKSCPSLPFNLQAGSECTLTLVFTPRAVGAATGQLSVSSDATNGSTQQVALTGTGEAAPELSSGGCSISQGKPGADPTLLLLVLTALGGLLYRRRQQRQHRQQPAQRGR